MRRLVNKDKTLIKRRQTGRPASQPPLGCHAIGHHKPLITGTSFSDQSENGTDCYSMPRLVLAVDGQVITKSEQVDQRRAP